jgi:hypothetical protein
MNRSAVQERLSPFFAPVWPVIVVRSALSVPGFRGISSLRSGIPRPCTPALPVAIDFSRQTGQKIVGGEGVTR